MLRKAGIMAPLIVTLLTACHSVSSAPRPKTLEYQGASLLRSYEPSVRYNTLIEIIRHNDKDAADHVLEILENVREEEYIRGTSAYALGVLGDKRALSALIAASQNKQEQLCVRDGAIVGLGRLKDRSAAGILERVVYDVSEPLYLRKDAVSALKRIDPEFYASIDIKN